MIIMNDLVSTCIIVEGIIVLLGVCLSMDFAFINDPFIYRVFALQYKIINKCKTTINNYGIAILLILTAPFLIPVNIALTFLWIIIQICEAICHGFIWLFKKR